MSAPLTIPVAIPREFSSRLGLMMALAVALGAVFTVSGIVLSYLLNVPSGATIILVAAGVYGAVMGARTLFPRD